MRKSTIVDIIAALFILLFVYAALSKFIDYKTFRAQLEQSPLLTTFAVPTSIIIPSFELIIAFMLMTNKFKSQGFYFSLFLMTLFSSYIIAITRFSEFIPCSCGGILQKMTWSQHLVFNFFFIVLALVGVLISGNTVPCGPASLNGTRT